MYFEVLQLLAYLVICVAVIFYCVLDGFDLGVGSLHIFARTDDERRIFLNAIGPLWDGNEVWLVIIGGGLFAAFPTVYAVLFSSFYTPVMILLAGIIFRAVAIEFRSKVESPRWRSTWDFLFFAASIVMTFVVGVLLGNLIKGIKINGEGVYVGTFWDFFGYYPILVGILGISLFMVHGLTFLLMKTEGELHQRIRTWMPSIMTFFAIFYIIVTFATFYNAPNMLELHNSRPLLYIVPILAFLFIINTPWQVHKGNDGWAFISSSLSIILLFCLFGLGTFPLMVRSSIDPVNYSLTLYNSSSAQKTLEVVLTVVVIGVPLVIAYGCYIYHTFRGKVRIGTSSY
ncbi:MAG: cytochrome d ubiquinol oxidase subunit II [Simkaniaceae bacterium]|nr:cytochrome d ubiquinol oxidase subunit II [Simkaniaceae bacterium]